jgi:hypothetical protein
MPQPNTLSLGGRPRRERRFMTVHTLRRKSPASPAGPFSARLSKSRKRSPWGTAGPSMAPWAGPATTRRSTVWATAGVFHWIRSIGLEASSRNSTA